MKLFNHLVAVAESTAPVIYAAFFWAISGCVANLVPSNKSNNKYVQNENFSLKKFLKNKQLAQDATPSLCIQAKSMTITLIVHQLVSNSLVYGERMIGGTATETGTARTSFSVTAGSDNC